MLPIKLFPIKKLVVLEPKCSKGVSRKMLVSSPAWQRFG